MGTGHRRLPLLFMVSRRDDELSLEHRLGAFEQPGLSGPGAFGWYAHRRFFSMYERLQRDGFDLGFERLDYDVRLERQVELEDLFSAYVYRSMHAIKALALSKAGAG